MKEWKYTNHYLHTGEKKDRAWIKPEWILDTLNSPDYQRKQANNNISIWKCIPDANNRWLRVVVLEDGETVQTYYFDRNFKPWK